MKAERLPLGAIQSNAAHARTQNITNLKNAGPKSQSLNPFGDGHIANKPQASHDVKQYSPQEKLRRQQQQQLRKQGHYASPHKSLSMRDFQIGRKLGRGKFGRVLLVRHRATNFMCALKTMVKEELVKYRAEVQFRREVEIQASLRHENILQIYGYFEDARKVYIMVEYSPKGELFKILEELGRLPPVMASSYVAQVAAALDYCHQRNIIHRDIKPENLLLGSDGKVKISDFGWSIRTRHKRGTLCGTLDYLPPEMVAKEAHTNCVDVWALGVLTYEFLTGGPPFYAKERAETYRRITKVDLKFPPFVEKEAVDFISALLKRTPGERMLLRDVPNHPWIQKHRPNWK